VANTPLTTQEITNAALMVLENQCPFVKLVSHKYSDSFGVDGAKIGDTIQVRKPVRVQSGTGQSLNMQDFTETSTPVTLTTQRNIGMSFSSAELLLSIDEFRERVLVPQIANIANGVEFDGLRLYQQVANSVGSPGTTPGAMLTYLQGGVKLDNAACPQDGRRSVVLNPIAQATTVSTNQALFNSVPQIKKQYEDGTMTRAAGLNWDMAQNINVHTVGAQGGTPVLASAVSNGANTLSISGASASITGWAKRGDVISFGSGATIAYNVNPQNYQTTGDPFQVVVTADADSDGAGLVTLYVQAPDGGPIYGPGTALQNVDALPGSGVAINFQGAASVVTPANMIFHRDAFAFVSAPLPLPGGTDMAARQSSKSTGLSLRIIRDYQIIPDLWVCRVDILYGWAAIRPQLACRVMG